MKKDLRSMKENRGKDENNAKKSGIPGDIDPAISDTLKQYSGKSREELMKELIRTTDEEKRDGKFDPNEADAMRQKLLPMLNEEQKKRLDELLARIKE